MKPETQALLDSFQPAIQQAEQLKSLRQHEGWPIVERLLATIRREALEDVLATGGKQEVLLIRIGHAQAVNTILNFLAQLMAEGVAAVADREALVSTIKQEEQLDADQQHVTRYFGHTGV